MEEATPHFVHALDEYLTYGAYACAGIAVLIFLYHEFRILIIRDYKAKYDYVNSNEIRFFWYSVVALILAATLYLNHLAAAVSMSVFNSPETWFYVRTFMTLCLMAILFVIFHTVVRIYYPRSVEKRLAKLRNKPRISPAGNVMRKLAESEEEAHLEAWQFREQQEIHSVDYDVWIDEKTGYKKIEKYEAYKHAEECTECGYYTLRIYDEEVATPPTEDESGLLIKHFKCNYCGHREAREAVIAPLSANVTA